MYVSIFQLISSRLGTTAMLVEALSAAPEDKRPKVYVQVYY